MSKRTSHEIKREILKILKSGQVYSFAELERKINTGFRSVVTNCKELESFGTVTIQKLNKNESNGRPYFQVSITKNGLDVLKKL